jgi:hypothetical protein
MTVRPAGLVDWPKGQPGLEVGATTDKAKRWSTAIFLAPVIANDKRLRDLKEPKDFGREFSRINGMGGDNAQERGI